MRYCWSHEDNRSNLITPAWFLIGSACVGGFLYLIYYDFITPFISLIILLLTVYSFLTAFITARRYRIDRSGLLIQYPFQIKMHIPWEQFSEIALCKIHYASATNHHILAIRCVVGNEKRGPKQAVVAKERWATPEYEILHCKNVISIYYTLDRISEFHSFCPHPIVDYRYLEDRS